MIFSYNCLQSFFKKRLPRPKELAEILTMKAFEVSAVRKSGQDWILDIDVLPNRAPDCFSHLGLSREIAAILGREYLLPKVAIKEDKKIKTKDFLSLEVQNQKVCPRYTARVIFDLKVSSSPKWIKERLKIWGQKPINNVVDIANYVMLETGQPLHIFDWEKLEGRKIVVRLAKEREKILTLDEEKYDLDEDILVIADAKKPIAIAGIKGGKIPEVDEKTKIVVLESANFDPRIIRRGSKKLGLQTDSSFRFEHGIDPNLTEFAIARAAFLIQEIAGGKVAKGLIDFYPKKVWPKKIRLDLDYVEKLLGMKIPAKEIKKILKGLGFKLSASISGSLEVLVPTFRLDISIPEDLVEEIGRIYGYEKIPSFFPVSALIPPKRNLEIFWEETLKNILKEAGFSEVYNYSFISQRDSQIFGYSPGTILEIENPVSLEQKYLRPSLIPNLLKNIQKNQKNFPEIKIFELGKVFQKFYFKKSSPAKIIEKKMLTAALTGDSFYQLKGIVDLLLEKLGLSNIWYDQYQPTPEESKISIWQLKKSGEIKVNGEEIGFLGEISQKILADLKIIQKVFIFDLDFEKLTKLASEEKEYQPISRFPAAIRDLAILVPRQTRVEEVLNKIEAAAGPLVRDIDLFDIYEGEEIPRGKKNLAFHLVYQSDVKTLSAKEIDKIQKKIIQALEKEIDWEVRR